MPREGLEPTLPYRKRILSPPRLPFRHLGRDKKAAGGFEPPHGGFADPCLNLLATPPQKSKLSTGVQSLWSGRRDSNSRPLPWQGSVLPLNYFRSKLNFTTLSDLSKLNWCRGGDLNSHGLTPTTPSRWRVYLFHHPGMAGAAGFEPTTCGFGDRCSTN